MTRLSFLISIFILTALVNAAIGVEKDASSGSGTSADLLSVQESFGNHPLYFIENQGQLDDEVAFYVKGKDKTLYFTKKGVTFSLHDENQRWNVRMDFASANSGIKPKGEDKQEAVFSYFRGEPDEWHAGIPTYSKIVYENLWNGIDLVYYGTVNKLKYDLVVKPGADPESIRFDVSGASDMVLEHSGNLQIKTPLGNVEDERPLAFQEFAKIRDHIDVKYTIDRLTGDKLEDHFSVGFNLDSYNHQEVLVIDPALLIYSGFLGGTNWETARDIAVDDEGNAYITGTTHSTEVGGFPVVAGFDPSYNGGIDIFIAKIAPSGDSLIYCSYLGGHGDDYGESIAIDPQGNAYIAGDTGSSEYTAFPVIVGPDLTYNGGFSDAFVAKVSSSGSDLIYCGYIGGLKSDAGSSVVVNNQGNAYVTGVTYSSETKGFPVSVGPTLTYNADGDAFVAKLSISGAQLEYCGYIGGMQNEGGCGISVDSEDNAYVGGITESSPADGFPVFVGPGLHYKGGVDGFVAKVDSSGASLVYCGYVGGSYNDYILDIAVQNQFAYLAGTTESTDLPTKIGPDLFSNGQNDAFVAKVNISGNSIVYCGYIGGSQFDFAEGIVVDHLGNAYVTGITNSSQKEGFPVLVGPDLTFNSIDSFRDDAYIAKVVASGASLAYCGYIGGLYNEGGAGIAVDKTGNAYVTGYTESSENNGFPVLVGPDLSYNDDGSQCDAFITKVGYFSLTSYGTTISVSTGGTIDFTLSADPGNGGRSYLMLGSFHGTEPGIPLPNGGETLPVVWDSLTNSILAGLNGSVFSNFYGYLNYYSQGTATLNCPPVNPNKIGKVMTFAYCLEGNPDWDFVSNPVEIEFVP